MDNDANVLFVRGGNHNEIVNESDDDVWDDTLLIKAYDRAVNMAKEEVAKRLSMETDSNPMKCVKSKNRKQFVSKNDSQSKWTVGSPCRAVYSVDGEVYEAIISKIFSDLRTCLVTFLGYDNTERVEISTLEDSNGLHSQTAQIKEANSAKDTYNKADSGTHEPSSNDNLPAEGMEYESEVPKSSQEPQTPHLDCRFQSPMFGMMPPAPPLPPQLMAKLPDNDADALSSMLMSWYISGFHTGYYHGIKQAEKSQNRVKKC